MKTLKSNDICGYLPYNLHIIYIGKEYICYSLSRWGLVVGESMGNNSPVSIMESLGGVKPVLRPFSDLYRRITHNGQEDIVPIVKIGKLCLGLNGDIKFLFGGSACVVYGQKYPGSRFFCLYIHDDMLLEAFSFEYDEGDNAIDHKYEPIRNTDKLFDFLPELKIDYRGLIRQGLALDANNRIQ
jgi:hypothetical protein